MRAREAPSGRANASAASIDSQTVKTTEVGGERDYDGGKKIQERKRHVVFDSLGLLMAVAVTSAAVGDAVAAPLVLKQLSRRNAPRLEVVWGDGKYHNHALYHWLGERRAERTHRWRLEIVGRPPGRKGFVLLPRRWVAERSFGWLGRSRRLSKDYERRHESSEAWIRLSSIHQMVKRLTHHRPYPAFKYKVNA